MWLSRTVCDLCDREIHTMVDNNIYTELTYRPPTKEEMKKYVYGYQSNNGGTFESIDGFTNDENDELDRVIDECNRDALWDVLQYEVEYLSDLTAAMYGNYYDEYIEVTQETDDEPSYSYRCAMPECTECVSIETKHDMIRHECNTCGRTTQFEREQ